MPGYGAREEWDSVAASPREISCKAGSPKNVISLPQNPPQNPPKKQQCKNQECLASYRKNLIACARARWKRRVDSVAASPREYLVTRAAKNVISPPPKSPKTTQNPSKPPKTPQNPRPSISRGSPTYLPIYLCTYVSMYLVASLCTPGGEVCRFLFHVKWFLTPWVMFVKVCSLMESVITGRFFSLLKRFFCCQSAQPNVRLQSFHGLFHPSIHLPTYLRVPTYEYIPTSLSLSPWLGVLSIYCMDKYISLSLSACLPGCLPVCLPAYLSVCLPLSLCV